MCASSPIRPLKKRYRDRYRPFKNKRRDNICVCVAHKSRQRPTQHDKKNVTRGQHWTFFQGHSPYLFNSTTAKKNILTSVRLNSTMWSSQQQQQQSERERERERPWRGDITHLLLVRLMKIHTWMTGRRRLGVCPFYTPHWTRPASWWWPKGYLYSSLFFI